ncbi:hypothetical protein MKC53_19520, partial [[Clostridium] innocuum]|nr:hypothetical protein [[Clostridium] innocuum]
TALRSCYCPLWVSPSRLAVDHRHETSRLPLAKRIYSAPYGRTDKEVMDMCNFSDFIEQRGKEEGKVEATLLHVKKLMQKIDVSAVDAMNILDVEEDIRPTVLQSLHLS